MKSLKNGQPHIITIEGIDGSGKGVQFKRIAGALGELGYSVKTLDFPVYGSFFGTEIGKMLSGTTVRADSVDGKSMALWFALDRWERMKNLNAEDAEIILINRYVLSNVVYQSIRDIDLNAESIENWVFDLEYNHFGIPRPSLNLVFSISAPAAAKNVSKKGFREYVGGRGKDVYERSTDIQERAMARYLELAQKYDDIAVVECMENGELLPINKITELALKIITEHIGSIK